MISAQDVCPIGRITKAHALRGEVVFQFTDDTFDRASVDHLIIDVDGILVPFYIGNYRFRSESTAFIKFDGIDTAEDAAQVIGGEVFLEKDIMSHAAEDDEDVSLAYYIGFAVLDSDGRTLGTVTDVDDQTENWLFTIQLADGHEVLVPAHEDLIQHIDHKARTLTMTLPDGLLEL